MLTKRQKPRLQLKVSEFRQDHNLHHLYLTYDLLAARAEKAAKEAEKKLAADKAAVEKMAAEKKAAEGT